MVIGSGPVAAQQLHAVDRDGVIRLWGDPTNRLTPLDQETRDLAPDAAGCASHKHPHVIALMPRTSQLVAEADNRRRDQACAHRGRPQS